MKCFKFSCTRQAVHSVHEYTTEMVSRLYLNMPGRVLDDISSELIDLVKSIVETLCETISLFPFRIVTLEVIKSTKEPPGTPSNHAHSVVNVMKYLRPCVASAGRCGQQVYKQLYKWLCKHRPNELWHARTQQPSAFNSCRLENKYVTASQTYWRVIWSTILMFSLFVKTKGAACREFGRMNDKEGDAIEGCNDYAR